MACQKREHCGSCNHHQCRFSEQSGYGCVDIFAGKCEVGEGCVVECEYSFTKEEAPQITAAQLAELDVLFPEFIPREQPPTALQNFYDQT